MTAESTSPGGVSFFRRLSPGGAFTILALLVWLFVHGDFGITWDEEVQSRYAEALWQVFSGGQSFAEFSHAPNLPANIYYYGPALDLACAVISHLFKADIYSVRHAAQGLYWVAMFYPVCALGRRLAGSAGGWLSGAALLGLPSLFGHAFNNPKDTPLACAAIWLLLACAAAAAAPRLGWRQVLSLGGALGFVVMVRPGAWFLWVLLGLVPLAAAWRVRWQVDRPALAVLGRTVGVLFAAVGLGWILMILPWPNAWHSPFLHPFKAATYAMHFDAVYAVLFRGTFQDSNQLPWDYLVTYLALTLPIPLLILAVWGHLVLWRRAKGSIPASLTGLGLMFLLWFPLVYFALARPNIYDGMRHFLFMLPAVAVLAGIAAADCVERLSTAPRWLVLPGVVVLLLSAVPAMVRLHPYQSSYYNWLAGSRTTLPERYETDYWLSSYREAAVWIKEAQSHSDRPLCVALAGNDSCVTVFDHFLDPKTKVVMIPFGNWTQSSLPPEMDYYVATVRMAQWRNFPGLPVAHSIERDGILFSIILANPVAKH